jgi:hypothetical protein
MGKKGTKVLEIEAPFYCEKCDKRPISTFKAKDLNMEGDLKVPEQKCPSCATPMDFDAVEEEYFYFLKYMRK